MKLTLISLLLILTFYTAYGQKQGNIWYFGDHAGLDFNGGNPVALTNGQIYLYPNPGPHSEGCSVICDSTGSLLFYSNGAKAWNKNHIVMPNGDSLLGHPSSTQAALIIPQPQSNRYYYVFTTDDFDSDYLKYGFRYSIVDICLNNGLGDVVTTQKNIKLLDTVSEKLTAVKHSNGIDYWVVTHKYFSDAFYSFLLTANGITDTVISHIGSVHQNIWLPGNTNAAIGQMKISPDGTKTALCFSNTNPGIAELFDFNASTGIVSNFISLPTDSIGGNFYGVEFSPDNSKLYFTGGYSGLYQFDLTAGGGNADSIKKSRILISVPNDYIFGLQLGVDGKIYVAKFQKTFLAAINNPNAYGTACNYVDNAVSLNGKTCSLGLPNFVDSYDYSNTIVNCQVGINELSNKNSIVLNQNVPNPFAEQTTINYYLPDYVTKAQIIFLEQSGKLIKTVDLTEKGQGVLNVFANDLTNGVYTYSLLVEGKVIDTKKMIKNK